MSKTPGRNDPCPCGSGKKYKRCCLASDEAAARLRAEQQALEQEALFGADDELIDGIEGPDEADDEFIDDAEGPDDYPDLDGILEEEESLLDIDAITRVCYTRGRVSTFSELRSGQGVEVTEWQAPDIPRELLDTIAREEVQNLQGRWGYERSGDPMQVDIIDLESDEVVVSIEVFNRAISLVLEDHEQLRRIHRVCGVLERASIGDLEVSKEPAGATSPRDQESEGRREVDRAALLKEHRRQPGTCALCGEGITRRGAKEHLAACAPQHERGAGTAERLLHLRVTAPGLPPYWLDLEAGASAKLDALDSFLRQIWLECCGHLSVFKIGDVKYYSRGFDSGFMRAPLGFGRREIARRMTAMLHEALPRAGEPFAYEYDFGSTTTLVLSVVDERTGPRGQQPVRLLARNTPPVWPCMICGEPATFVCSSCLIEGSDAFVCATHEPGHTCDESEALMPVVNSPRVGVCGYTGEE